MSPSRPRRILIHPGFHKTGTSSIQHFLWVNRRNLRDHLATLQLRHLKPVAQLCMRFARSRNPLLLSDLVEVLDEALSLEDLLPEADDPRDIVISCEALSGHCPGWPGVMDYGTAPYTVSVVAGYFAERFPGAEIIVVYSTREPEPWLYSAWGHHLLGQRLRAGFEEWAPIYRPASDLQSVVSEVADAIAPHQVFTLPLEESRIHPKGPGGALLELIDLPAEVRDQLTPVGQGNAGPPPDLITEYLALNRSALTDADVRTRKAALLEEYKVGGWAPPADPTAG